MTLMAPGTLMECRTISNPRRRSPVVLDRQRNVPTLESEFRLDPARPTYDYRVSGLTNTQCIDPGDIGDRSKLTMRGRKRGESAQSTDVGPASTGNIKALL